MSREDSPNEVQMLGLPLLTAAVLSQGLVARFRPPPDLVIGQKVKLRIAEPAPYSPLPIAMPGPMIRPVTLVGTLMAYEPYERITLLRHGSIAGIGPRTERSVEWIDLMGIEVPQRRNGLNALNGALAGFGVALGVGLTAGIFDSLLCGGEDNPYCKDQNGWHYTKRLALYAVPAGTIIGFFSTRWKRVL